MIEPRKFLEIAGERLTDAYLHVGDQDFEHLSGNHPFLFRKPLGPVIAGYLGRQFDARFGGGVCQETQNVGLGKVLSHERSVACPVNLSTAAAQFAASRPHGTLSSGRR